MLQSLRNNWKKAVGYTAGAAVALTALGYAASVGLEKMDQYDLAHCESKPTTYACQERYKAATRIDVGTNISEPSRAQMDVLVRNSGIFPVPKFDQP